MSSEVNYNIDGANPIKYFVVYWDILHMIDGAKPQIEGVNQSILV